MGLAKVANNWNNLVKGSLTKQKLQNSKGYAKSPEFSPALVSMEVQYRDDVPTKRKVGM